MNQQTRKRNRRAFTLIEILVVIVIIAVLAGAIAPTLLRHIGEAKTNVAKSNISSIESAINIFSITYDRMPNTLEELVTRPADIDEANWAVPTLRAKDLIDPWGRPFLYKQPGDRGPFDVYSLGKDGQEGGEGDNADIGNWQ